MSPTPDPVGESKVRPAGREIRRRGVPVTETRKKRAFSARCPVFKLFFFTNDDDEDVNDDDDDDDDDDDGRVREEDGSPENETEQLGRSNLPRFLHKVLRSAWEEQMINALFPPAPKISRPTCRSM